MLNKIRKDVQKQNPIMKHLMYIVVPVLVLIAFYLIGVGAKWVFDLIGKMGWSVPITFIITSAGWNIFYGYKELQSTRQKAEYEDEEDDEEDEDEDDF